MYKPKYPKKKKIQSDQKIREREKESKAHLTGNTSPARPGLAWRGFMWLGLRTTWAHAAWVARDLGRALLGRKKPRQRATQVACNLGHALLGFLCAWPQSHTT